MLTEVSGAVTGPMMLLVTVPVVLPKPSAARRMYLLMSSAVNV